MEDKLFAVDGVQSLTEKELSITNGGSLLGAFLLGVLLGAAMRILKELNDSTYVDS